jgi:hypothetical protein
VSRMPEPETVRFSGEVLAVKGRIRLIRSFDQVSHQYQGYTLILRDDEASGTVRRIAIGPGAHAKHQFRIGDRVSGTAHRVPDLATEWAEFYRVSGPR